MARSSVATDDFNRANGALGANWQHVYDDNGSITISGNVIGGAAAGAPSAARWNGPGSFSNDQYSSLVIVDADVGSSNYAPGVIARASGDTNATRDYYYFFALSNDNYELGKIVNGTDTTLASGAHNWVTGDRIELECEGTTIRGMKNGSTVIASVTDSSLSSGKPGVTFMGDAFLATGDDWEGGDITASADADEDLTGSASTSASGTAAPGISIGL